MSSTRTNARKAAVQALYQWQMTGQSLIDIELQFEEQERFKGVQKSYFKELFHGVPSCLDVLDATLTEFVDRPVDTIDPVERAILRMGIGNYDKTLRYLPIEPIWIAQACSNTLRVANASDQ